MWDRDRAQSEHSEAGHAQWCAKQLKKITFAKFSYWSQLQSSPMMGLYATFSMLSSRSVVTRYDRCPMVFDLPRDFSSTID